MRSVNGMMAMGQLDVAQTLWPLDLFRDLQTVSEVPGNAPGAPGDPSQ
jgi:hypothetical protein